MNVPRLLLRLALGQRLPRLRGDTRLPGPSHPITIRRDKWGVPAIEAATDADAAFALGFCHGQDRAGQLEVLWRVGRGRLAEWVGAGGLPTDRMSRRLGFRRSAEAQLGALSPLMRDMLDAYTRGVNVAHTHGLSAKPHEFAILGGEPTPWDAADVLAILKLQTFSLPSNWDVELARLRLLQADGPEALRELDPLSRAGTGRANVAEEWERGADRATASDAMVTALAADLGELQHLLPLGGGSNNWVVAGSRTASGKPLLANDPHLSPTAPAPWYMVHIHTPEWTAAGATMPGTPGIAIGHNGFAAWGVTAGLTDNTDLFLETLGPDGRSVREADGRFTPCEVATETIRVKGGAEVVEQVLLTPRGPVVTPLAEGLPQAISFRAVWLDPLPVDGLLSAVRADSFESFRAPFAHWPVLPLSIVYADTAGNTGWLLAGQLPRRKRGHGLLPMPADAANAGWEPDLIPLEQMPFEVNPTAGYFATANNDPAMGRAQPANDTPLMGHDFIDPYRFLAITNALAGRTDWDVAATLRLQTDVRSLPWDELRPLLLSLEPTHPEAREALALLREWNGAVEINSSAATVFELFVAEMCVRAAKAKAPTGWAIALGESPFGSFKHNLFTDRRVWHLVQLLREQPAGWLSRPWPAEMEDVLTHVMHHLRRNVGPGPAYWGWGHLRQLRLNHPLFRKSRLLGPAFNLGPVPCAGDANTINQAGARPTAPTAFTHNMANLRLVVDLADVSASRFVLAGGQSGNPCSPHHADQFPLWQAGEALPLPWHQDAIIRNARATLRLLPAPATDRQS